MASSSSRNVAIAAIVVIAMGAGMFVGRYIAAHRVVEVVQPAVTWHAGDVLPPFALVSESGDSVTSTDMLTHGGVVLVLDLECPPCVEMAQKWNRAINDGVVRVDQVIGITMHSRDAIARFRADTGIQFAVYRDAESALLSNGWVMSFPLEVIVGEGGTVVAVSGDSTAPIDQDAIQAAGMGGL
ncbi:MAG TPA: redoxin domain-containing protein [Candidatus Krumholzibacteria bacterium]|nr:redoxin domain-containing protein [Candidatus Krumholzibacteria bacterium]